MKLFNTMTRQKEEFVPIHPAIGGLRLRDLVFMVWKLQVHPAAVQIDGLAQISVGHGRTLDVPARPPHSPGGFPRRFARLCRLPQCKIHGVLFVFAHCDAGARL